MAKTTWDHEWKEHPKNPNWITWKHDIVPLTEIELNKETAHPYHRIMFQFTYDKSKDAKEHVVPFDRLEEYRKYYKLGLLQVGVPTVVNTTQLKKQKGRKNRWWEFPDVRVVDMRPEYEDFDEDLLRKLLKDEKLEVAQRVYTRLLEARRTEGQDRYIKLYEQYREQIEQLIADNQLLVY